jgi:hypothetical protein
MKLWVRLQEEWMRRILSLLMLGIAMLIAVRTAMAQGAPPSPGANAPYTIEYYYKVQWGHQQEFLSLFLKNHYPLLKKIVSTGRMTAVKIEAPAYHSTEDGRWDYRVTITYPNATAAVTSNPDEERLIKELYPDHDKYEREEQRRFEILVSHWDLPVTDITPKQ